MAKYSVVLNDSNRTMVPVEADDLTYNSDSSSYDFDNDESDDNDSRVAVFPAATVLFVKKE